MGIFRGFSKKKVKNEHNEDVNMRNDEKAINDEQTELMIQFVASFDKVARELGLVESDTYMIPTLQQIRNDVVDYLISDERLAIQVGQDPGKYLYILLSYSAMNGANVARKWYENKEDLMNYVCQLKMNGPIDDYRVLIADYYANVFADEIGEELFLNMYNSIAGTLNEYLIKDNPVTYTMLAMFAAFDLGTWLALDKTGYEQLQA